jgi:hypothetical protein
MKETKAKQKAAIDQILVLVKELCYQAIDNIDVSDVFPTEVIKTACEYLEKEYEDYASNKQASAPVKKPTYN